MHSKINTLSLVEYGWNGRFCKIGFGNWKNYSL